MLGVLGLSCEARRLRSRRTKIPRKDPQEREKKERKLWPEREKKERNFGRSCGGVSPWVKSHSHMKKSFITNPTEGGQDKTRLGAKNKIVRICESAAHKHGVCPPFGFEQAFMWSIAGRRLAMFT